MPLVQKTLTLLLVLTNLSYAAFPDGKWNGKPWEKEQLLEGVSRGDKDALAEWAYCSIYTYLGIKYEPKLIYQRSKLASEKGSVMGTYLTGLCELEFLGTKKQLQSGFKHIIKAKDAGHPLALLRYSRFLRLGDLGVKKDAQQAFQLMTQCAKDGAWEAHRRLAYAAEKGLVGVVDFEKAAEHYRICLEKHRDPRTAYKILDQTRAGAKSKGLIQHFPQQTRDLAEARVKEAANLGHPLCNYKMAFRELKNGNINIAIPWLVNMYNDKHKSSFHSKRGNILRVICWHWYHGRYSTKERCQMVGGNYISTYAAAKVCYKSGQRTQFIKESFSDGILYDIRKKLVAPEDEKIAVDMMRALIVQGTDGHDPHHILGEYFTIKYNRHKVDKKEFDRGMAHLIYHSKCDLAAYWVAYNYLDAKKSNDFVKGVAAAQWAIPMNDGLHLKWMKKWLARSLKKMSPAEKKAAQKLVDEGFPHADKFRKEAFEYLQKVGDIPADRKFKENAEEPEELEEASAPAEQETMIFIQAFNSPLMLADAPQQPLFTPAESTLFANYLSGKKFNFNEAKRLVILLTKNEDKLDALLTQSSKGKHAARVKELRNIIGQEHDLYIGNTPLEASVGWYLTYNGDKVFTNPYITQMISDGPSAKAGLLVGDMIEKVNGVDTRNLQSRNLFVRLISCWPKELPMHLQIKRGKFPHKSADDSNPKVNTKKIILTLPKK